MKLFEYVKEENKRIFRILGFTVLKQTSDYMTADRYQEFLGGLITTYKIKNQTTQYSEKEIKLFGKSITRRYEEDNYRTYFFAGKEYRKVSILDEFKKKYFRYFNKDHDDIYILNSNSGEAYLTLAYIIDSLIKKNGSRNPLLVATQKYHMDLIEMICPDIPHVYIKKIRLNLMGSHFEIDNHRCFMLYDGPHFIQVEADIRTSELGKAHYFQAILSKLQIDRTELRTRKLQVLPEAERTMLGKIRKTGLNLEKFVLIAPEAKSCKLYDAAFWCEMIDKFQAKGYDVFANIVDNEIELASTKQYKSTFLSYSELYALARYAKKIVSLRSGLTEILVQAGKPTDVLYTKFRERHIFNEMDTAHVLSGFSLMPLPHVNENTVREFNMAEIQPQPCLDLILDM